MGASRPETARLAEKLRAIRDGLWTLTDSNGRSVERSKTASFVKSLCGEHLPIRTRPARATTLSVIGLRTRGWSYIRKAR